MECLYLAYLFLQTQTVMYVNGQGVVPGGYVMAQGPGGVPMAFPVQQAGGVATVPGGHTQVVHLPPQGMVQVAGQPPTYQMSTSGAQMGQVPTFGAEGGHPPPYNADQQVRVMRFHFCYFFNLSNITCYTKSLTV